MNKEEKLRKLKNKGKWISNVSGIIHLLAIQDYYID